MEALPSATPGVQSSSGVDSGELAEDSSAKWAGSAVLAGLWVKGDSAGDMESTPSEGTAFGISVL